MLHSHRTPRVRPLAVAFGVAGLASALSLAACKKDAPEDAAKDTAGAAEKAADEAAGAAKAVGALAKAPGTRLESGEVLGHVLMPNGAQFLKEVKTQLAVPQVAAFVDEGFIRGLLAGQLGPRGGLSQNVLIDQPVGCAVVDPKEFKMPAACHLPYKGGVEQLLKDLGDEGKQADAQGHAAMYTIDGQSLYFDTLGEQIVVTGHAELFAKTKDYLQNNLIARGPKVVDDFEFVVYASKILERYESDLQPFMDEISKTQAPAATGDPKVDRALKVWTDYNTKSTADTVQRLKDMDQLTMGMGLEPVGMVFRFAIYPKDGSRLQKESIAAAAGPVDMAHLTKLPASSWFVVGAANAGEKAMKTESMEEMKALVAKSYAEFAGKDAAKIEAALTAHMEESARLYGNQSAFALAHEPNTVGGMVAIQKMKDGDGRAEWKAWSEAFTPKNILPKEYQQYVTWSFKVDAAEVDGVAVDRWVIEPTGEVLKELEKEKAKDPEVAAVLDKIGGARLVIDRASTGGITTFVVAPAAEEAYVRAALNAQKGTDNLAGEAGLDRISKRHPATSALLGVNVAGVLGWVKAIAPAKETKDIPEGLGSDLGDFFFATSYTDSGLMMGEFAISQPFIDQIKTVIEREQQKQP